MIDPTKITRYNLKQNELEERLLFWVCAAGKNGRTAAKCLDTFLTNIVGYSHPFISIFRAHSLYDLPQILKYCGIGCYNSKARTFFELSKSELDLKTCTVKDLENIYGIGRKTSRCFLLHSRKNVQCAGLDTHMLKHLRFLGIENVPLSTPASEKEYVRLEKIVLGLASKLNKSPAEYDLEIWNSYSTKNKEV